MKRRKTKIAVAFEPEKAAPVPVAFASKAVQREVNQILDRAVFYERLAVQARTCAAELQLKIWL